MIRYVLEDAIAIFIFTLGGALYGTIILKIGFITHNDVKRKIIDFFLGVLGGVIFILLTEIYYSTVVKAHTLFCYLVGFLGILIYSSERKPKPKKEGVAKNKKCDKIKPRERKKLVGVNSHLDIRTNDSCYRNLRFFGRLRRRRK